MKKLHYAFLLFIALFIFACKTNTGSAITAGAKVISQCCTKSSEKKSGNTLNAEENGTAEAKQKVSSILPAYVWDTKMMIW